MTLEVSEDSSLHLKKRARRRLVGAIALVILMLIILPNVLQNRAKQDQGPIEVMMPQSQGVLDRSDQEALDANNSNLVESEITVLAGNAEADVEKEPIEKVATISTQAQKPEIIAPKAEKLKDILDAEAKSKATEVKKITKVNSDVPKADAKRYMIQIGAFAEPENVKRLQAKIALTGFGSHTKKKKALVPSFRRRFVRSNKRKLAHAT